MLDPAEIASEAVDATFDVFSRAGLYRSAQDEDVACSVILGSRDQSLDAFGAGRPVVRGETVEVRASEVATPERGGAFLVGGRMLRIVDAPRCDDPERLVWKMTVQVEAFDFYTPSLDFSDPRNSGYVTLI
jgi:hypothetical protein